MLTVNRSRAGRRGGSNTTIRSIIYGTWITLIGAVGLTIWAFTRGLNVHASEHSTGSLRTRSLAAVEAPEDSHHGRLNPKSWRVEDNLEEAFNLGRVHYANEAAEASGAAGGAPAPRFCKTEEDEGGSIDLFVQPSKIAIRQVTHPLPQDLTAGFNISCAWTRLQYKDLPPDKLNICTYSPQEDTVISSSLHREGKWVGVLEWEALRATGGGVPRPSPGASKDAAITPPASLCSKKKPFLIDVGAGFGSFSLMAAASGCQIIAFEPWPPNMARMMRSFEKNGFLGNASFFLNAIHRSEGTVSLYVESHNPGAARVVRKGSTQAQGSAGAITLSSFFQWNNRPRNPYTGRRLSPSDVAAIRVDTEGHGLAVLDSLRDLLAVGQPPVISVHFYPGLSRNGVGCDAMDFLHFAYARGYKFYLGKELWTKARWVEYLEKETWSCQPMIVHRGLAATGSLDYKQLAKFESQDA